MGARSKAIQSEIAVVGYAARLPGADSAEAFWKVLLEGESTITEIPPERWSSALFDEPGNPTSGKSYTRAAGVLDDPFGFDADYFRISRREAEQMDPQQRLLLETTARAFDHAGIDPDELEKKRTGVYVGAASSDHSTSIQTDPSLVGPHFMLGNTLSIFSNRLSYHWDLQGPSMTVDTACSSSLFALDLARKAIDAGEIDTAVVAGVNLLLSPLPFIGFSQATMLSKRGVCAPFSDSADGYVRSEGAVVFILQRKSLAELRRLNVRSTLVATAVNTDGATNGLPLPSSERQTELMKSVTDRFEIDPEALAFVEAHGTGTPVGDPREAAAIGTAYGTGRSTPLPIGSAKANFGHLEPAAGLVGLLKAQMSLEHACLPAHRQDGEANSDIDFQKLNLTVPQATQNIPPREGGWLAAVNSFGFGGANAHAVLRQAKSTEEALAGPNLPNSLLLSAANETALRDLAGSWQSKVREADDQTLVEAVATNNRRVSRHPFRTCLEAGTRDRLLVSLENWSSSDTSAVRAVGKNVPVGFVYSGNGTAWAGMARDIFASNSAFQAGFRDAARAFDQYGLEDVESLLFHPDLDQLLDRAEVVQPLIFSIQVALTRALAEVGVTPAATLGHSVGEFAAAVAAERLSIDEAARIITSRCAAFAPLRGTGTMAAMSCSREDADTLIQELDLAIDVAAENAPRNVSLSGSQSDIETLLKEAKKRRMTGLRLAIEYPYHSRFVDEIRDTLSSDVGAVESTPSAIPFYSGWMGGRADETSLNNTYWLRNVRETVSFRGSVAAMANDGIGIFLEISPRSVLQGNLRDILRATGGVYASLGTLEKGKPGKTTATTIARRVIATGGAVDEAPVLGPRRRHRVSGPDYPFQREPLRLNPSSGYAAQLSSPVEHSFLGRRVSNDDWVWRGSVSTARLPWLADHKVAGQSLLPAMAMLDMFRHAATEFADDRAFELIDIEFLKPVNLDHGEIDTKVSYDEFARSLRLAIRTNGSFQTAARAGLRLDVARLDGNLDIDPSSEAEGLYDALAAGGLDYGPAFARLAKISKHGDGDVDVALDAVVDTDTIAARICRADALLHGLATHMQDGLLRVPQRIARARFASDAVPLNGRLSMPDGSTANVLAADGDSRVVMELVGLQLAGFPRSSGIPLDTYDEVLVPLVPTAAPLLGPERVAKLGAEPDALPTDLDVTRSAIGGRLAWDLVFGNSFNTDDPRLEFAEAWLLERDLATETESGIAAATQCPWPELDDLLLLLAQRLGHASDELAASLKAVVQGDTTERRPLARARQFAVDALKTCRTGHSKILLVGDLDNAVIETATALSATVMIAAPRQSELDLLQARLDPRANYATRIITEMTTDDAFDLVIGVSALRSDRPILTKLAEISRASSETLLIDETADALAVLSGLYEPGTDAAAISRLFRPTSVATARGDAALSLTYCTKSENTASEKSSWSAKVVGDSGFARDLVRVLPEATSKTTLVVLPENATSLDRLRAFQNCRASLATDETAWIIDRTIGAFGELCGLRRVLANETGHDVRVAATSQETSAEDLLKIISNATATETVVDHSGARTPRVIREPSLRSADEVDRRVLIPAANGPLYGPDWETRPRQTLGETDIEIRVDATGVNFRDVMLASGTLPEDAFSGGFSGRQFGMECAGRVIKAGAKASFKEGDRVAAFSADAFATTVTVPDHFALKLPEGISSAEGATLPVAFLTADYALRDCARLSPGESVLIHGGAGGVGMAAIQIAQSMGLKVYATAGSPEKRRLLHAMSVDGVFDSRSLKFASDIMKRTDNRGVDAVINSLAGQFLEVSLECLAPFGRFVELGKRDIFENSRIGMRVLRNNISFLAVDANQLVVEKPKLAESIMRRLSDDFVSGALKPLPHASFSSADVAAAFDTMRRAHHIGKIVVSGHPDHPATDGQTLPPDYAGTWLITGGTRGFGLATAKWLAERGASTLWLVSRSGDLDEHAKAELEASGADVKTSALDIGDASAVQSLLETIRNESEPLTGIVHSAALLHDAPFADTSEEKFLKVLHPKIEGARHLDALTRMDAPEYFWLYSSVATRFGNPGQAAYAAANGALEDLARERWSAGAPALAIAWSAIDDAGHLATHKDLRERISASGVRTLQSQEALDRLHRELVVNPHRATITIGALDWSRMARPLPVIGEKLFDHLHISKAVISSDAFDLAALISEKGAEGAARVVSSLLAREIALLLRIPEDKLELNRPLNEMGFDSLMGMQLLMVIEERLALSMPTNAFSERTTLNGLAQIIVSRQDGGQEEDETAQSMAERHLTDANISPETREEIIRAAGDRA